MANARPKARTVAAVLVAFLAVLGLPAQAAFAQDAGFDLNVEPEISSTGVGGDVNLNADISPSNSTGAPVVVNFEVVQDADGDSPDTPDGGCAIAVNDDDCNVLFAGVGFGFAGGSTASPGTFTVVGWVDNPDLATCNADRAICGSSSNEEQATVGGRSEPDDTDVVTVNVEASEGFKLDCSPDTQQVATGITPGSVTCTQTDQNGVVTAAFEVDLERIGGPNDTTPGQQSPVDTDGVNGGAGTFTYTGATIGASDTSGILNLCFFLDRNSSLDDTGAEGPTEADGGGCATEALNAGADDADGTDVVCIAYGSAVCGGSTSTPTPTPTDGKQPPVIAGEGCLDGSDQASFRINIGQELEEGILGGTPLEDLFDLIIPPTTLSIGADDPDGGPTSLHLTGAPSWIRLEPATPSGDPVAALIVGEPSLIDALALVDEGLQDEFTVVATDDEGATDTCVFTAFVGPEIDFPGPFGG